MQHSIPEAPGSSLIPQQGREEEQSNHLRDSEGLGLFPALTLLCSCLDPPATSGRQILNRELSCEVSGAAPIVLLRSLPGCWGACSDSRLALLLPSLAKNPSCPCELQHTQTLPQPSSAHSLALRSHIIKPGAA